MSTLTEPKFDLPEVAADTAGAKTIPCRVLEPNITRIFRVKPRTNGPGFNTPYINVAVLLVFELHRAK